MNIRVNADRAVLNLARAQKTGFREVVNEQGELVKDPGTTGLKAKLVSLVERGSVRSGSLTGRVIETLVGVDDFANILSQLRDNKQSSMYNVHNALNALWLETTAGMDKVSRRNARLELERRTDKAKKNNDKTGLSLKYCGALRDALAELADAKASRTDNKNAGAASTDAGTVNPMLKDHLVTLLIDAARGGINAARDNLASKILDAKHSTEDVRSVLESGDGGIRRATTALNNISQKLKPETLPSEALKGAPEQWQRQFGIVADLVNRVATAEFNADIKGNFTQYGTSQSNPFKKVVTDFPKLDYGVRNWLAEGVDLAGQLLAVQERAITGQEPLSDAELDKLQRRVDEFANSQARATGPVESDENMEPASEMEIAIDWTKFMNPEEK